MGSTKTSVTAPGGGREGLDEMSRSLGLQCDGHGPGSTYISALLRFRASVMISWSRTDTSSRKKQKYQ